MTTDHGDEIVHRELSTDADGPAIQVAEIVADLEDVGPMDVPAIWGCIDDMLGALFTNPPAPEAQVEVTFSYQGYRVTVEQNGSARFVQTE